MSNQREHGAAAHVVTEVHHNAIGGMRARRDSGVRFPKPDVGEISLRRAQLIESDMAGLDLSGADFNGADLSGANLVGARLIGANLRGACLHGALLEDAELMGADLSGADLSDCRAPRAGFGKAKLEGAVFFNANLSGATFTGANLKDADLRVADLRGARLVGAELDGACLENVIGNGVDLTDCSVAVASFRGADLREARFRGIEGYHSADWVGTDIRNVDFAGAMLLRRHALDENYLAEFRAQSKVHEWIYKAWWLSSDCGRSFARWACWTILVAVVYAGLYALVHIDYGDHETFLSPLYFSIVTFTTLGYGDVLPATSAAQIMVLSEVVLGYMALGGLVSIMGNKLARRAD
ncbi:MAG: hypothetical protein GY898_31975 [Proteobacteria bacterium]|nr:hypothetical protein [Pseudomonadota bacterium]